MPTFDFRCAKCGHVFEFTRPFGSKETPKCEECGSKKTEKLISPPAVHFKGSGWYKTDSGSSKKSSTPAKSEPTSEKKTSTDDTKPAKPEKKAPEKKSDTKKD